ncbi:MAG: DUF3000 domain-containing protein [Mycobacteriales bacterium]
MTPERRVPVPPDFATAVSSLRATRLRPEIMLDPISPPQRLAPFSHAIAAEVVVEGEAAATGRLVLLCDPNGQEAWDGTLRLVTFASAELDPEMAGDPLLAEVGWSWLLDALHGRNADYTAAGGTVTQTSSMRFGDLSGPPHTVDIELRASWTPLHADLGAHLLAWGDLLCTAAGLPPPGVAMLPGRGSGLPGPAS